MDCVGKCMFDVLHNSKLFYELYNQPIVDSLKLECRYNNSFKFEHNLILMRF